MDAKEQIALSKALSKRVIDDARELLTPGVHNVDVSIRISGSLSVSEDYFTTPTVSIPLKETMALLLHRMGFQREAAITILREVMTEAIGTMGCGKNALADALPIVVEAMEMVETEILAHLPQQSRKGPVRASLAIEEIGVLA